MAFSLKEKKVVIIEPKAHLAGHYSFELKNFCNILSDFVQEIVVLTPFGFKENINPPINCTVLNLITKKSNNAYVKFDLDFSYQWEYYREVRKFITKNRPNVIHIWDIVSTLPIFIYLFRFRKKIVLTLKEVERQRFGGLLKRKTQRFYSN